MSPPKSQYGILSPLVLGDEVNFRLIYDGPLKAASQSSPRRIEKHKIRLALDTQLTRLFYGDELLEHPFRFGDPEFEKYKRGRVSYWPIVRKSMHMVCDLDILFLRRGIPGRLISPQGDLDNRIKVLFDALRVPADDNEVRGLEKTPRGILCLLEDDNLITGFRVTSDQLLEPAKDGTQHDVRLIVNVEIKLTRITKANIGYLRQF
jgi:hypothetical protein